MALTVVRCGCSCWLLPLTSCSVAGRRASDCGAAAPAADTSSNSSPPSVRWVSERPFYSVSPCLVLLVVFVYCCYSVYAFIVGFDGYCFVTKLEEPRHQKPGNIDLFLTFTIRSASSVRGVMVMFAASRLALGLGIYIFCSPSRPFHNSWVRAIVFINSSVLLRTLHSPTPRELTVLKIIIHYIIIGLLSGFTNKFTEPLHSVIRLLLLKCVFIQNSHWCKLIHTVKSLNL